MSDATLKKAPRNGTRERIALARAILAPSPVLLNRVPGWLRLRLLKRYGCSKYASTSGPSLLMDIAYRRQFTFIDHWGISPSRTETVFVAEPYLSVEKVESAIRFAEELDLELNISPNSWWYPSATTRLEFRPRKVQEAGE